jgi:D-aspartate ligase
VGRGHGRSTVAFRAVTMTAQLPVAVVLSCHYNGLSIIQELGSNGIPCIAMDSKRSIGTFSRFAHYVRCPNPAGDESMFIEFLRGYCAGRDPKPILIPTNDEWAVALSRHKARLSEVAVPCVGDWPAVAQVIEKDRFYDVARERSYPVPNTWRPHEIDRLSRNDFPIVAKPRFRRYASDGELVTVLEAMERLRLTVIHDERDLGRFMAVEKAAIPHLIFQELVHGASDRMYTVGMYVDRNFEPRGVFTGHKVRGYPADIGDCIVGEVQAIPDELVELSMKLARDIELTGIMEFEYKCDSRTGEFRLIEVNPRSWSWIGITPTCGVSLPLLAYRDLALDQPGAGSPCRVVKVDKTVRYYRAIADFINSTVRYRYSFPEWRKTPLSWWRELRMTPEVVMAEFRAGDRRVALVALATEVRTLARQVMGAAHRRIAAKVSVRRRISRIAGACLKGWRRVHKVGRAPRS